MKDAKSSPPTPGWLQRLAQPLVELFGLSRGLAASIVSVILVLVLAAFFWFFYSAPPRVITITSGAPGSSLQANAEKYRDFLATRGITK